MSHNFAYRLFRSYLSCCFANKTRLCTQLFAVTACLFSAGCVTPQTKIESERRQYLADPTIPSYGYNGKLTKGGEPYLFLYEHDPAFGDFLLTIVPTAKDPRIVVAALTYFGSKRPDPVKFEKVIALINPQLLDEEVNLSSSDAILMVPLGDWIADARKQNQAKKRSP